ncbi:MAG TPA: hypothetical protein VES59_11150 [Bacteroidota bacterium]|nr:hypothetical protein [Bacteroidota bacterium]
MKGGFAAGCSSYEPLQVVSAFDQGTWVGTFSSTQDFGRDGSIVQSGSVTIEFGRSMHISRVEAGVTFNFVLDKQN